MCENEISKKAKSVKTENKKKRGKRVFFLFIFKSVWWRSLRVEN